jgi:ribosomal protein L11 methylase PrmA
MTTSSGVVPGSFRDPSGFIFWKDGTLYRRVSATYRGNYDHLVQSGLYDSLVDAGLLVAHEEVPTEDDGADSIYKVLRPDVIPFISYPYEWSFSQLKDAALATLEIERRALDFGMSLKDASAYNVQFTKGKPILIDTLSFERYHEGQTWPAYRQFCQHFLAPLALMSRTDVRLSQLLRVYVDGIPLDLASSLLPLRTRLSFSLLTHVHLHARSQRHFAGKTVDTRGRGVSRLGLLGLVGNLESTVKKLRWRPGGTAWAEYYEDVSYSEQALDQKKRIVAGFLDQTSPETVWDLGANTGLFSRIASAKGMLTISFDMDPSAVEENYLECVKAGETNLLPLLIDLTNPSPNVGWENQERMSIVERGPAEMVLALGLIHHLAISNNLPFARMASFFSKICHWLVLEFVAKTDSQVRRLLRTREDIFQDYTEQSFLDAFEEHFSVEGSVGIDGMERTVYLLRRRIENA